MRSASGNIKENEKITAVAVAVAAPAAVQVAQAVAQAVAQVVADVELTDMICERKSRLLMQFHITGQCNLRCKHCYRTEGDVQPLSYDEVITVFEQFKALLKEYKKTYNVKAKGHVNITGGEPFFRKDIKEILEYMGENKDLFSYGVLSNGYFLDEELISVLKKTGVRFIQMSIDGNRKMHDYLRAPGDYDRVFKTARMLKKNGILPYISFTANRDNYKYLPLVARKCRLCGVKKLWTDRLVPIGNGQELEDLVITSDIMPDYLKTIKKAQGNQLLQKLFPNTIVESNRALQFLGTDGLFYHCGAGHSLIIVDEFGNIMPCRRMPIICGNIKEDTLRNVFFDHEVFMELRELDSPDECGGCIYSHLCRGGAKCQSYATYNSYEKADPGCWFCH